MYNQIKSSTETVKNESRILFPTSMMDSFTFWYKKEKIKGEVLFFFKDIHTDLRHIDVSALIRLMEKYRITNTKMFSNKAVLIYFNSLEKKFGAEIIKMHQKILYARIQQKIRGIG